MEISLTGKESNPTETVQNWAMGLDSLCSSTLSSGELARKYMDGVWIPLLGRIPQIFPGFCEKNKVNAEGGWHNFWWGCFHVPGNHCNHWLFELSTLLISFLRCVPIAKKPYQTEQFSGHNWAKRGISLDGWLLEKYIMGGVLSSVSDIIGAGVSETITSKRLGCACNRAAGIRPCAVRPRSFFRLRTPHLCLKKERCGVFSTHPYCKFDKPARNLIKNCASSDVQYICHFATFFSS